MLLFYIFLSGMFDTCGEFEFNTILFDTLVILVLQFGLELVTNIFDITTLFVL